MFSRIRGVRDRTRAGKLVADPAPEIVSDFEDLATIPWQRSSPKRSPSGSTLPALRVRWSPQVRILVS
jgi:hypothetical protein